MCCLEMGLTGEVGHGGAPLVALSGLWSPPLGSFQSSLIPGSQDMGLSSTTLLQHEVPALDPGNHGLNPLKP